MTATSLYMLPEVGLVWLLSGSEHKYTTNAGAQKFANCSKA